MKRIDVMLFGLLLGASVPVGAQPAREGAQELDPEAFQQRVEANRAAKGRYLLEKRMERAAGVPVGSPTQLGSEVRLEAYLDGMVILSRPVGKQAADALARLGVRALNRPMTFQDGSQAVYDGRRYWRQVTRDIPEWKLDRLVGRTVQTSVQRFEGEGVRVVEVVEASTRSGGPRPSADR
ncbi:MAG: hypothetical protein AAF851_12015 [Myxococcota bacterium]